MARVHPEQLRRLSLSSSTPSCPGLWPCTEPRFRELTPGLRQFAVSTGPLPTALQPPSPLVSMSLARRSLRRGIGIVTPKYRRQLPQAGQPIRFRLHLLAPHDLKICTHRGGHLPLQGFRWCWCWVILRQDSTNHHGQAAVIEPVEPWVLGLQPSNH